MLTLGELAQLFGQAVQAVAGGGQCGFVLFALFQRLLHGLFRYGVVDGFGFFGQGFQPLGQLLVAFVQLAGAARQFAGFLFGGVEFQADFMQLAFGIAGLVAGQLQAGFGIQPLQPHFFQLHGQLFQRQGRLFTQQLPFFDFQRGLLLFLADAQAFGLDKGQARRPLAGRLVQLDVFQCHRIELGFQPGERAFLCPDGFGQHAVHALQ